MFNCFSVVISPDPSPEFMLSPYLILYCSVSKSCNTVLTPFNASFTFETLFHSKDPLTHLKKIRDASVLPRCKWEQIAFPCDTVNITRLCQFHASCHLCSLNTLYPTEYQMTPRLKLKQVIVHQYHQL